MSQPGLLSYEPAYADEVAVLMAHAFGRIQAEGGAGGSTYLRLSTRGLPQPERTGHAWRAGVVEGGLLGGRAGSGRAPRHRLLRRARPEALAAHAALLEDDPDAGLLAVTLARCAPRRLDGRRP
jgi:pyruvate dehydrogenase E1 component